MSATLISVNSSAIRAVGYEGSTLTVEFHNGRTYNLTGGAGTPLLRPAQLIVARLVFQHLLEGPLLNMSRVGKIARLSQYRRSNSIAGSKTGSRAGNWWNG
jgi:hypothetical protein